MIRNAVYEDEEAIYRLCCLLENTTLDEKNFKEIFDACFDKDIIYVTEEDGKVIGFLHMRIVPEFSRASYIAEISELIVEEEYRNRHYGRDLLEQAKKYCEDNSIPLIEVLSSFYRKDAHRFYENNGFEKTGYRFFNEEWIKDNENKEKTDH